jgi:Tfp pilus assembly protein PilF
MQSQLSAVDAAIAGGYLTTARETLASMRPFPTGEEEALRLLKRAFAVANGTGDYSLLNDMAGTALASHGRSARIRAVAAYAALRAGRLSAAEKSLGNGPVPPEAGDMLRGESILRRGGTWAGSDSLTRDLLSLEKKQDPSAYVETALSTGEKRLSLDAALLDMEAGNVTQARTIARTDLAGSLFDEPAAYILYDYGDSAGAIERLARLDASRPGRPEIQLLIADAWQGAGNSEQAEKWLLRGLPLAPGLSWTPYVNLALFALQRGDMTSASKRLADGLAFFPRARSIRMAQARLAIRAGDTPAARSLLAALVQDNPADSEASLLLLTVEAQGLTPEAYRARLWKLFNRVPSDVSVFNALSTALLAAHDWEGAGIAIGQHQASRGEPDKDLLLVIGMVAAMQGADSRAREAFRASADMAGDGRARYDLALILLGQGNAQEAKSELETAMEECRRKGDPADQASVLSRMETLRGTAFLMDGDTEGARAAFVRAIQRDAGNLRAGLLLRKLDAGGQ